jgi:hypothetical protein
MTEVRKSKSNQYLLIMWGTSFVLSVLFTNYFSGTNIVGKNYIDELISGGFNYLLRALIFFILLEPISLLWKKYIRKKELLPFKSREFWEDEVESLFVYWIIFTLLFLPGYPIWYLLK